MFKRLTRGRIASKLFWSFLIGIFFNGCTRVPLITVVGAYFPDWLFCGIVAVALTVVIHVLAKRGDFVDWLNPLAVVYPTLTLGFALIAWLILFYH